MDCRIKRGDIYYIYKAEVCGCEQHAGRPGIIVSCPVLNETAETVEVVFLTTRTKKFLPTHVEINSCARRSTALCEQITTVAIERVGTYYGHVTEVEIENIDRALNASLGLSGSDQKESVEKIRIERDTYRKLYEDLIDRVMGVKKDGTV